MSVSEKKTSLRPRGLAVDIEKMPECCESSGSDPHMCPLAAEIYDDDSLCDCCAACEQACNDEI